MYDLMMKLVWETLRTFSQNDKQLQGTPGAIAVLHTHARNLDFHPHVHVVMPAAAIDKANKLWRTKKSGQNTPYLFNHTALAKVFRAKMLEAITGEGLVLPAQHPKKWVVDCTSVGSGEKALIYLGRYLYRGVIREKDIVSCKKGKVTFRYQNSKTKKTVFRTVSGEHFLWLVLQHILPKRFRRTRNFGFLHPNSKRLIQVIQLLLGVDPNGALAWIKKRPKMLCRYCGGEMNIIETRISPASLPTTLVPT
jgi:hypothetical protein